MEKIDFSEWQKFFFLSGALLGFLAVAIGAFGAHALKQKLDQNLLVIFEVGVRYQMYHVFALLIVALLYFNIDNSWLFFSGWSFLVGTLIFSGSLYILALTGIKAWGAVTPIGGLFLLAGWLFLFISGLVK